MPTYDYECDSCGHAWELFQKMTDDAVKKCPECNRRKARRLFGTGAAIMFKGSGFYQTDYRSDSYKKGEKAEKKATETKSDSAGKKSSDSTKSEPKPAASETKTASKSDD